MTEHSEVPRLMTLREVAQIIGRPSAESVAAWVARWNRKHPEMLVRRAHGRVHIDDLRRAIEADLQARTPGIAVARTLESQAARTAARSGGARA